MFITALLKLAWLIPLFPFLACAAIFVFAGQNRTISRRLALGGIVTAFVLSQIVFWGAVTLPVGGGERAVESWGMVWFSAGVERFRLGTYIDPLHTVMLFTVPLVCLMIFIYSSGTMNLDPPEENRHHSHFLATMSLLISGMLGMIVFDNLLALFMCWEIIDACSYLLISSWHKKEASYRAGLKVFLVTKIGDLCFMLGVGLLYREIGSLAYRDIFSRETLEYLGQTRFLGTQWSTASVIGVLILGGAISKSAQFPFHIWLADAVECPIPTLALIHAATTAPAGAFLIIRTFPIFAAAGSGVPLMIVGVIGVISAILASAMAIAQNDIRRVLALSTIGHLGYVFGALGTGAYAAGAFHVITHAFFKALLFLGAGSVIRGVAQQHRESETRAGPHPRNGHSKEFDPSDVTNMGGLARHMPRTFRTFLVGGLALAGFPLVTAGFWSQNPILAQSYESSPAIFWGLAVAVGMTAFYTMRLVCLIFCGEPRTQAADGCYSLAGVLENTPKIIAPLIILALFSAGLGWAGIPEQLPIIGGSIPDWFHHFVSSTIETAPTLGRGFVWQPMALGAAFSLGGLALGWLVYGWKPMQAGEMDRLETAMRQAWLGWLYACLRERFYLDQICQATIVRGSALLADLADAFDQRVLDGLANLAGHAGRGLSRISAWLDAHVVDAAANVVGHAGGGTSRVCDAFDRQVVDRMVGLTSLCLQTVSGLSAVIDVKLVDGAAEGVSRAIRASGRFIRPIQSGNIQDYLLRATLMLLTLIAVFLLILFLRI